MSATSPARSKPVHSSQLLPEPRATYASIVRFSIKASGLVARDRKVAFGIVGTGGGRVVLTEDLQWTPLCALGARFRSPCLPSGLGG
jgi:hypothetical protein